MAARPVGLAVRLPCAVTLFPSHDTPAHVLLGLIDGNLSIFTVIQHGLIRPSDDPIEDFVFDNDPVAQTLSLGFGSVKLRRDLQKALLRDNQYEF